MKRKLWVVALAALTFGATAYAQSAHDHDSATSGPGTAQHASPPAAGSGMGMQGQNGMEGMHGMHGQGGQGMHGMHGQGMGGMHGMRGMRFPPGYEKLELQMHAEMMESMARIMKKYAAQLPDK